MAYQSVSGLWVPKWPEAGTPVQMSISGSTLNGDEHELQIIGKVQLSTGTGTSKTFDNTSTLEWLSGTITFVDDGANDPTFRVGVKQASSIDKATGVPVRATVGAAAFDVYGDYVGGTDTISANAWQSKAMSSGSLSIAHGDDLAICFHLDKPGAAAQSVTPRWHNPQGSTDPMMAPAITLYNGSTYSLVAHGGPIAVLEFSDGTVGWIDGSFILTGSAVTPGNLATWARANILNFPYDVKIDGIITCGAFNADMYVRVWSTPLGTPSVVQSYTWDKDFQGGTGNRILQMPLDPPIQLTANTDYAFGVEGTASITNNLPYQWDVADTKHHVVNGWDDGIYAVSSTGGAGAFTSVNSGLRRYAIFARVCAIDIPTGGGGLAANPIRGFVS